MLGLLRRLTFPALAFMALIVAFSLSGCGDRSDPAESIGRPMPIRDDYDARLGSDGNNLWLARTSKIGKELKTSVFEFRDEAWKALPGAGLSSQDSPLQLVPLNTAPGRSPLPCLGDSAPDGEARLRCLQAGKWKGVKVPATFAGMGLADLKATEGKGIALFSDTAPNASMYRLARVTPQRIVPLGSPVKLRGQVLGSLGESTSGSKDLIDVGFMGQTSNLRWVATFHRGGGWSHTPLLTAAKSGSQLSGPVRTPDSLIMVTSEIHQGGPWLLSVFDYEHSRGWSKLEDEPLADRGQSQGGTYAVGSDAWVIWNQMKFNDVDKDGLAPTKIKTARIGTDGQLSSTTILWRGRTLVPANTQVVEFKGKPVFLFFSQTNPKSGMNATVKFSSS